MSGDAFLGVLWTAVIVGAVSVLVQLVLLFKVRQNIVKTQECINMIGDLGASLVNSLQAILQENRRGLAAITQNTNAIAMSAREITTEITELVRYARHRFA